MLLYIHPTCTTCKKALKWLDDHHVAYETKNIKEEQPDVAILTAAHETFPLTKMFNTSGQTYRELGLKDKLKTMTDADALTLLASDGMLIKRPVLIKGDTVLFGFKEDAYEALLNV